MYKKILSFAIAIAVIMTFGVKGSARADNSNGLAQIWASVDLNGNQLDSDALVIGGTVYIPVRSVCEGLGCTVNWTASNGQGTVTVISDTNTVVLDIAGQTIAVNGFVSPMKDDNESLCCFLNSGHTYLSSDLFSKAFSVSVSCSQDKETVTITDSPKQINTETTVGGTVSVSLKGNPTTGYGWYYIIGDTDTVAKTGESYLTDSNRTELTGVGGTYTWTFKALKKGGTTITFKYYRSWLGESSATAADTVVYKITVK